MAVGVFTLDAAGSNYCTLRYTMAVGTLANGDTFTFGLFGDGAATIAAPAGWAGNGTGVTGATGQTESITAAQRTQRTLAFWNYLTTPIPAAATSQQLLPFFVKGGATWQITTTFTGVAPNAQPTAEFYVVYLNSMIR